MDAPTPIRVRFAIEEHVARSRDPNAPWSPEQRDPSVPLGESTSEWKVLESGVVNFVEADPASCVFGQEPCMTPGRERHARCGDPDTFRFFLYDSERYETMPELDLGGVGPMNFVGRRPGLLALAQVLRHHPWRTRDPSEACIFIPALVDTLWVANTPQDSSDFVTATLARLPHWNGGKDHLIFDYGDHAPRFNVGWSAMAKSSFSRDWDREAYELLFEEYSPAEHPMRVGYDVAVPLSFYRCDGNLFAHLHRYDNALAGNPELERRAHELISMARAIGDVEGRWKPLIDKVKASGYVPKPMHERRNLLVFKGATYQRLPGHPVEARNNITALHNGRDIHIHLQCVIRSHDCLNGSVMLRTISDDPNCGAWERRGSNLDFDAMLDTSVFAAIIPGEGTHSYRLLEVIQAGSIPVFIGDSPPPFMDLLPWATMAVFQRDTDEESLQQLPFRLRSIPLVQRTAMQLEGQRMWVEHLRDFPAHIHAVLETVRRRFARVARGEAAAPPPRVPRTQTTAALLARREAELAQNVPGEPVSVPVSVEGPESTPSAPVGEADTASRGGEAVGRGGGGDASSNVKEGTTPTIIFGKRVDRLGEEEPRETSSMEFPSESSDVPSNHVHERRLGAEDVRWRDWEAERVKEAEEMIPALLLTLPRPATFPSALRRRMQPPWSPLPDMHPDRGTVWAEEVAVLERVATPRMLFGTDDQLVLVLERHLQRVPAQFDSSHPKREEAIQQLQQVARSLKEDGRPALAAEQLVQYLRTALPTITERSRHSLDTATVYFVLAELWTRAGGWRAALTASQLSIIYMGHVVAREGEKAVEQSGIDWRTLLQRSFAAQQVWRVWWRWWQEAQGLSRESLLPGPAPFQRREQAEGTFQLAPWSTSEGTTFYRTSEASDDNHRPPPRVAVVSLCDYDGSVTELTSYSFANKMRYCRKHGYNCVLETQSDPSRPPAWSKILLAHRTMQSADWVFWLDCDSFVTNSLVRVEDVLKATGATSEGGPHLVLSEDAGMLNTGVFLVRSSPEGKSLLERVYGTTDDPFINHPWWEQAGLMSLLVESEGAAGWATQTAFTPQRWLNSYPSELSGRIRAAEQGFLHATWRPGDFIISFSGCRVFLAPAQCETLFQLFSNYATWKMGCGTECSKQTGSEMKGSFW